MNEGGGERPRERQGGRVKKRYGEGGRETVRERDGERLREKD